LTALAVLNFVFAGLSALSLLGAVAVVAFSGALKEAAETPEDRQVFEALENMNMGLWVLILVSGAIALVLLIVSGVGYLKMRKWGRSTGNLYAITAIVSGALGAVITPSELGGGFSISTIIGLIYPVLTLYFLNVSFKDDLTSNSSS